MGVIWQVEHRMNHALGSDIGSYWYGPHAKILFATGFPVVWKYKNERGACDSLLEAQKILTAKIIYERLTT